MERLLAGKTPAQATPERGRCLPVARKHIDKIDLSLILLQGQVR